jgi:hypothetical protein
MGDGKASTLFAEFSRKCLLSNIERICTVHRWTQFIPASILESFFFLKNICPPTHFSFFSDLFRQIDES